MSEHIDVNFAPFWEEVYRAGRAGWDLGGPTPVFRHLLEEGRFPPGKLIAPGAGRGHDARLFARYGFDVTAVDFASDAVQAMLAEKDPDAPVKVLQSDIFDLPHEFDASFDYLLEYTCFCAIDPARRAEYADLVKRLLRPGGIYIDLAFPLDPHPGGPPYTVSIPEIMRLFGERGFDLLERRRSELTVKPRRDREELLIWRKP